MVSRGSVGTGGCLIRALNSLVEEMEFLLLPVFVLVLVLKPPKNASSNPSVAVVIIAADDVEVPDVDAVIVIISGTGFEAFNLVNSAQP